MNSRKFRKKQNFFRKSVFLHGSRKNLSFYAICGGWENAGFFSNHWGGVSNSPGATVVHGPDNAVRDERPILASSFFSNGDCEACGDRRGGAQNRPGATVVYGRDDAVRDKRRLLSQAATIRN